MVEKMKPNEIKEAACIIEFLEEEIQNVPFHIKRGEHIKIVDDKILFSVVGYKASGSDRKIYLDWEHTRLYSRSLVSKLKKMFWNWDIDMLEEELVILPKKH